MWSKVNDINNTNPEKLGTFLKQVISFRLALLIILSSYIKVMTLKQYTGLKWTRYVANLLKES